MNNSKSKVVAIVVISIAIFIAIAAVAIGVTSSQGGQPGTVTAHGFSHDEGVFPLCGDGEEFGHFERQLFRDICLHP